MAVAAFAWSTPVVREGACSLPLGQPGLERACCQAGFVPKTLARDDAWTPAPVERAGYLRQSAISFADEASARADAEARLAEDAANVCAASDVFQRLAGAQGRTQRFDCREGADGWRCAANYVAACALEEQSLNERCE
jgi:hypothetical protein